MLSRSAPHSSFRVTVLDCAHACPCPRAADEVNLKNTDRSVFVVSFKGIQTVHTAFPPHP